MHNHLTVLSPRGFSKHKKIMVIKFYYLRLILSIHKNQKLIPLNSSGRHEVKHVGNSVDNLLGDKKEPLTEIGVKS